MRPRWNEGKERHHDQHSIAWGGLRTAKLVSVRLQRQSPVEVNRA